MSAFHARTSVRRRCCCNPSAISTSSCALCKPVCCCLHGQRRQAGWGAGASSAALTAALPWALCAPSHNPACLFHPSPLPVPALGSGQASCTLHRPGLAGSAAHGLHKLLPHSPAGGGRRQEGMGRRAGRPPAVLRPALHRHQGTAWGGAGDYQTANQSRLAAARVPCRSRCYDWLLPCCSCCTLPCCRRRRTSALESRSAWRMGSGTLGKGKETGAAGKAFINKPHLAAV